MCVKAVTVLSKVKEVNGGRVLLGRLQLQAGRPLQLKATRRPWCRSSLVPSAAGALPAEHAMEKTIMQTPQSMFYNGTDWTEKFTVSSFTSLMEIFLSML